MVLKKKVIAGTIAASLTFTALAGLPLSDKGLAEKLGINVAYAADSNIKLADWASKIKKQLSAQQAVYSQSVADAVYLKGEEEFSVASVTYAVYNGTPNLSVSTSVYDIAKPVVGKLNLTDKDGNDIQEDFSNLVAGLIKFMFNQDTNAFNALRDEPSIVNAVYAVDPTMTFADLDTFLFDTNTGVQASLISKLNGLSATDVLALGTDPVARNKFFDELFASVLTSSNSSKVVQLLLAQGVTSADFADVVRNFRFYVGPEIFDKACCGTVHSIPYGVLHASLHRRWRRHFVRHQPIRRSTRARAC